MQKPRFPSREILYRKVLARSEQIKKGIDKEEFHMGGDRETFLEGKTPGPTSNDVSGSVANATGGRLRIHQSGGEVHFHDDDAHLKASVPVAEWWKAWETLSKASQIYSPIVFCTDPVNNTQLKVTTAVTGVEGQRKKLEAYITLESLEIGTNFRELQQFTKRR